MAGMIRFPSNGSHADGYLAEPETGNGIGVIVIQEWWGMNDQIKKVTDRFAAAGFLSLCPDLYHGKVTSAPDEAGKLMMAMKIAHAERDLRGAAAYLKEKTGKPVGVVGFCMGGALSLYAACKSPDIGASVIYYGGHPKVEYEFGQLSAAVLGHWAEDDDFANATIPLVEPALKEKGHRLPVPHLPGNAARVLQRRPTRGLPRGGGQVELGSDAGVLPLEALLRPPGAYFFGDGRRPAFAPAPAVGSKEGQRSARFALVAGGLAGRSRPVGRGRSTPTTRRSSWAVGTPPRGRARSSRDRTRRSGPVDWPTASRGCPPRSTAPHGPDRAARWPSCARPRAGSPGPPCGRAPLRRTAPGARAPTP